ncbi:hypothetical protein ACFY3U_10330 [Micromonospora sp. NPDC000089]|uniref:hypothetical protein n=1 Tax=unclassified Micromonospora TaxID=2617518 RepID=UPI0036ADC3F7
MNVSRPPCPTFVIGIGVPSSYARALVLALVAVLGRPLTLPARPHPPVAALGPLLAARRPRRIVRPGRARPVSASRPPNRRRSRR